MLQTGNVKRLIAAEDYKRKIEEAAKDVMITNQYLLETREQKEGWTTLPNIQENQSTSPVNVDIEDDDLAQVLYTSGTESAPKGVWLSRKSIITEYIRCA